MNLKELEKDYKKEEVKPYNMRMTELTHERLRYVARKNGMTMAKTLKILIDLAYKESKQDEK